jgi:hypothetical protein
LISYFAFFSLGILSIIAGSLGLAACTLDRLGTCHSSLEVGERVVVALIKYQCKYFILLILYPLTQKTSVGLSVIYIFAAFIPYSIVSHSRVLVFNIALCLFLTCGQ